MKHFARKVQSCFINGKINNICSSLFLDRSGKYLFVLTALINHVDLYKKNVKCLYQMFNPYTKQILVQKTAKRKSITEFQKQNLIKDMQTIKDLLTT